MRQNPVHVAHPARLHNALDVCQRPRVRRASIDIRQLHPVAIKVLRTKRRIALVDRKQRRRIRVASLPFHVLRKTFMNPSWRMTPRLLLNEAVREFVF